MYHENEVVMLILGLGTLVFIFLNYTQLKRLPSAFLLLTSFVVLLVGWLATVLEGFFLADFFNYLEHSAYALSSVLLMVWCWKTRHPRSGKSL